MRPFALLLCSGLALSAGPATNQVPTRHDHGGGNSGVAYTPSDVESPNRGTARLQGTARLHGIARPHATGTRRVGPSATDATALTVAVGESRTGNRKIRPSAVVRVGIHDIQGSGRVSPLDGADVVTEGVVTAVTGNGFFLQTAAAEVDANPATSQGILVFTGGVSLAAAAVGNRVEVTGRVDEYTPTSNPHQLSVTEIVAPSVMVLTAGNALPAPVALTAAQSNPASEVDNLERYEGMRVSVPGLTVTAATEGSISETDVTSTANGNFYGVLAANPRPFREPGIGALDVTPVPGGVSPPRFDTNPERIRVQSLGQAGAIIIAPDAGATVAGFNGVLDYAFGTYTVLPDPGQSPQVTGGQDPTPVAVPMTDEVTIASFNLLRLYDDVDDPGSDVVLTADAFQRRLVKTALAVCLYLHAPDVLGVVEVENLNVLTRLATVINDGSGCQRGTRYVPYLQPGNDAGNLNLGFLVRTADVAAGRPRVQVQEVVQFGKADVDTNPNGSTSVLNDRPPLMLRAIVNQANGGTYPLTVIANHLRSLSGVNSTAPGPNGWSSEGARIRAKRASQARFLADLVHARQVANPAEHLVLLGDFNAFEFNDGFVDSMGIVTGREAPASQVLHYVDSPITTPLTNMTTLAAPQDRYSFVFEGSAQALDHMVVNAALLAALPGARVEHARINADFGVDNFGDYPLPIRVSDHDPVQLYLPVASFGIARMRTLTGGTSAVTAGKPVQWPVFVENNGPDTARNVRLRLRANFELPTLVATAPAGLDCGAAVVGGGETVIDCTAPAMVVRQSFELVVSAQTTTAMAGTSVTFSSNVVSDTPDNLPDDNLSFIGTLIAPPDVNIGVGFVRPDSAILNAVDRVDFIVANSGRDAAESVRVVMSLISASTKLTPIVPAGWTCEDRTYDGERTSVVCRFAGEFASGRIDTLGMGLYSHRSALVVVSAGANSPPGESQPSNNFDSRRHTALIRGSKPPRE
ncbi:MAG: nuclease [Arenimonas sp.]|nr:nuclease [Arenimonas sp.]